MMATVDSLNGAETFFIYKLKRFSIYNPKLTGMKPESRALITGDRLAEEI